ncbi:MAG: hypothetical protein K6G90_04150 [Clostridia bacterium]|nr:hypothetical protein [Clostridia bacterium]
MRRINAFCLFLTVFLLCCPTFARAVRLEDGIDALREQWSRGKGPESGGFALEYSYYEPESASGENRLPLFVFMAGAGEGSRSGKELTDNDFANWSSEEFQSRALGGGACLQILKAPEPVYFDTVPVSSIFAAINDFAENHFVDKSRIYVLGWCIGAAGAANVVLKYPSYFAGLGLISPRVVISSGEAEKLKDTSVWIFGCKNDTYSAYGVYVAPSWKNLVNKAEDGNNIRLTTSRTAPRAAAIFNHMMWRLLEYDFAESVLEDFKDLKTLNGDGEEITFQRVISWFTVRAVKNGTSESYSAEPVSVSQETPSLSEEDIGKYADLYRIIIACFRKITAFLSR